MGQVCRPRPVPPLCLAFIYFKFKFKYISNSDIFHFRIHRIKAYNSNFKSRCHVLSLMLCAVCFIVHALRQGLGFNAYILHLAFNVLNCMVHISWCMLYVSCFRVWFRVCGFGFKI